MICDNDYSQYSSVTSMLIGYPDLTAINNNNNRRRRNNTDVHSNYLLHALLVAKLNILLKHRHLKIYTLRHRRLQIYTL